MGASGDLAPLAHLALPLIGEGMVYRDDGVCSAKEALEHAGLVPLKLQPKEGLSLINGTHFMTTLGSYAIEQAYRLLETADLAAAMSLSAIRGTSAAYDERIHRIRPHQGQALVAANLLRILSGPDSIKDSHKDCDKVQDPYSFRCVPQVHGASRDVWKYVHGVFQTELNSVTDNPLVFEESEIISGGNFHGQPLAMSLDFLSIAMAEIGSISERRIEKLTNPEFSGLPAFVTENSGLNSGFMIPHVVAAALVADNRVFTTPASVDSIPTSADKEDHVSMGPIAADKALKINQNLSKILAIEFLTAAQGVDLLAPLKPARILREVHERIRKIVPYTAKDKVMHQPIEELANLILMGEFVNL